MKMLILRIHSNDLLHTCLLPSHIVIFFPFFLKRKPTSETPHVFVLFHLTKFDLQIDIDHGTLKVDAINNVDAVQDLVEIDGFHESSTEIPKEVSEEKEHTSTEKSHPERQSWQVEDDLKSKGNNNVRP